MTPALAKTHMERTLTEANHQSDDCCFGDTLSEKLLGATKVTDFAQYTINQIRAGKGHTGCCIPAKQACDFGSRVVCCKRLHQPSGDDSINARCNRLGCCLLGGLCCATVICTIPVSAYVIGNIMQVQRQSEILAPPKQIMK